MFTMTREGVPPRTSSACSLPKSCFGVSFSYRTREGLPLDQDDLDAAVLYARRYTTYFCSRFPAQDPAQVESSAIEGAYVAWKTYDPSRRSQANGKTATWTTFLANSVRWAVVKGTRPSQEASREKFDQQYQVVSLDASTKTHKHSWFSRNTGMHLHDLIPDPSQPASDRIEWKEVLALMPELERWVLAQRYYYTRTCEEIAATLKGEWTQMKVWRLEKRAIQRLRIMLGVSKN